MKTTAKYWKMGVFILKIRRIGWMHCDGESISWCITILKQCIVRSINGYCQFLYIVFLRSKRWVSSWICNRHMSTAAQPPVRIKEKRIWTDVHVYDLCQKPVYKTVACMWRLQLTYYIHCFWLINHDCAEQMTKHIQLNC